LIGYGYIFAKLSDVSEADRVIAREQGSAFARAHGMMFIECSAKTKDGVQQAFHELVQKVHMQIAAVI